jgi:hypothetical protein
LVICGSPCFPVKAAIGEYAVGDENVDQIVEI